MTMAIRNWCRNVAQLSLSQVRNYSVTAVEHKTSELPILSSAEYIDYEKSFITPREAWIENLHTIEEKKIGLISLHPEIFGAAPRTDIIHSNVRWQRMYRYVCYRHTPTRNELPGGNRKPWPQKGTGRARHGSRNSPLFLHGAKAHGPRSHKTYFYMLPYHTRIFGLTSMFSIKLAQDDLRIVPNLDLPTDDPKYLSELIEARKWGPSVLFADADDVFPEKIALAAENFGHVNLMPTYGLNVYSMLKHVTLVLTEKAVRKIEEKILYCLHKPNKRLEITSFKKKLNQI